MHKNNTVDGALIMKSTYHASLIGKAVETVF